MTAMVGFLVQFGIFSAGLIFFVSNGANVHPNWRMIFLPGLLVQTAMLGIGLGLIISALSTRFRDLTLGAGFVIQLWMYASSVVFPISRIPVEKRALLYWNPIVPIIEGFRFAFLGSGLVEREHLWRSFGICAAVFFIGVVMFNRAEQKAMDTV
jgi:lipopolysaccharide transport system permease protein